MSQRPTTLNSVPIPDNYLRFTLNLNGRGPSGIRANTLSARWQGGLPPIPEYATPEWFGGAFDFAFGELWSSIRGAYANSTSLESVSVQTAVGGATQPAPVTLLGTRVITLAPPQMAVVGQWRTQTPGRRGRGRIFFTDAGENDFGTDGVISPQSEQLFADVLSDLIASFDNNPGITWPTGLDGLHLLHSDGGTPSRIVFGGVNPQPGWLRRRGR